MTVLCDCTPFSNLFLPHDPDCAACTSDGAGVTYNENVNVALAVAMPDGGLITPVIKDADKTDIYQISRYLMADMAT